MTHSSTSQEVDQRSSIRPSRNHAAKVLRARHTHFIYRGYKVVHLGERLTFRSEFLTSPDLVFRPEVTIDGVRPETLRSCPPSVLDTIGFHLGLMEIPSYWKATCSPTIVLEAAPVSQPQLDWLKDLLIQGMGEFFYVNNIDFTAPDFITLKVGSAGVQPSRDERAHPHDRVLVPLSGGKDSIVTWDTLSRHGIELGAMTLNPTQAARQVVVLTGCPHPIRVERAIDPTLLRLNACGYLNGHTPFSSYLAFLAVSCAMLFGFGRVAMSNERSSNEGNITYHKRMVNHQYSKSFDFEQKFRQYAKWHLASSIDFFSFLRPLYETQIVHMFAKASKYHAAFRSCNKGQAHNAWCGSCPKCLSVYSMIFPFVDTETLQSVFSVDLFSRLELTPLALDLLTYGNKPFECVGTHEENIVSFYLCTKKLRGQGRPLPPLLQMADERVLSKQERLEQRAADLLSAWNHEHAVPQDLTQILRAEVPRVLPEHC